MAELHDTKILEQDTAAPSSVKPPRRILFDDVEMPPTEDELPYDDGEPMESDRHALQITLLKEPLQLVWAERDNVCVAGNLGVYYSLEQADKQNFRAPDFFLAVDVQRRARKSYVIWFEGKAPDLVVELLSDSTAAADRGLKKQIYQDNMRVPEYILFDVETGQLEAYRLGITTDDLHIAYREIALGRESSFMTAAAPDFGLMCWEGEYGNMWGTWLRWFDGRTGEVLPTGAEMAKVERKRADEESKRAEKIADQLDTEREKVARMAAKLRTLGINPDEA